MTTVEQLKYARVAGALLLAHILFELLGDYITIGHSGESLAATSMYVSSHVSVWRWALLSVAFGWILSVPLSFALYVVQEPVSRRAAQLAMILRTSGAMVGASSLTFRYAKSGLNLAFTSAVFTPEQFAQLESTVQQGANAGVFIAWILVGMSSTLTFAVFTRMTQLPRALSRLGVFSSVVLILVAIAMFTNPQLASLKALLLLHLVVEVTTAAWLLLR